MIFFFQPYAALTFPARAHASHIKHILFTYLFHLCYLSGTMRNIYSVYCARYTAANSPVWSRSSTRRSEASSLISLCVHIKRINPYYIVYNSFPFSSKCNMCLRSVGIMVIASIKLLIFMNDVLIFHSGNDSPLMLTNCSGPGLY